MALESKSLVRARSILLNLIIAGAIGLVAITAYHFYVIEGMSLSGRELLIERVLAAQLPATGSTQSANAKSPPTMSAEQSAALAPFALEADVLKNRYRAVDALILTRTSIVYIIIFCGLTMVTVGSSFILFRIDDQPLTATGAAAAWSVNISTASPGIVLAIIGALLVAVPWIVDRPISVREGPSYIALSPVRPGVGLGQPATDFTPVIPPK